MPGLCPLTFSVLLFFPGQGPNQEELLDTILELGIDNEHIRIEAQRKIQKQGARMVPVIRKELETGSPGRKRLAAQAAELIGPQAEPLIDVLILQLASEDLDLRGPALAALGGIGAPARQALPAIARLPQPLDPETERLVMIVRSRLVADPSKLWSSYVRASRSALPRMRYAGLVLAFTWCKQRHDLVPQFLAITRDPDPEVRKKAQALMAGLGTRGRDEVAALAQGKNPLKSVQAMMLLGHFDLTTQQLVFLLAELEKRPRNQAAAQGLLAAGSASYPAVLARFTVLVREEAPVEALDRFLNYFRGAGPSAKGVGKELRNLLARPERELRMHALATLRDTGHEDPAVEAAILGQLTTKDRELTEMAIAALGASRAPSAAMLGLLVDLLGRSKNSAIRRHSAQALGKLGDRAAAGYEKLALVLEGADVRGKQLAAVAFGAMDVEALGYLMARFVGSGSAAQRVAILRAFAEMGPKARPAIPLMQKALESPDADLRETSLLALARAGDAARVAIPNMLLLLQDEQASPGQRLAACTALAELGVGDARLLRPLIATSRSSHKELARLSLMALGELSLVEGVPRLIEALGDPDPQMRWRAAFAIGRLGRDGVNALPALKARLGDTDAAVRYQTEKALREVRGG